MRKIVLAIAALVMVSSSGLYALDTVPIVNMRDRFLSESKELMPLLTETKDIILVNSMLDACLMTVSQLNAYFYMVGVFNTIKDEDKSEESVSYLIKWLTEIKATNEVNLKSLNSVKVPADAKVASHVEKLKGYFIDLNKQVDLEVTNLSLLVESLKIKQVPQKPR